MPFCRFLKVDSHTCRHSPWGSSDEAAGASAARRGALRGLGVADRVCGGSNNCQGVPGKQGCARRDGLGCLREAFPDGESFSTRVRWEASGAWAGLGMIG